MLHNLFFDSNKIKNGFSDIPKTIFKIRDCNINEHKNLLTKQEFWFSHPFDLNDPFDLRPLIDFNLSEIKSQKFLYILTSYLPNEYSYLKKVEKQQIVLNVYKKIIKNPSEFLNKNLMSLLEKEDYDNYGVLSLTINHLNCLLWENYGNKHTGFAIGYNTIKLIEHLNCSFGFVKYSDSTYNYSFNNKESNFNKYFFKKKCWSYEQEFRFLKLTISSNTERLNNYPIDAISSIVLGRNISKENELEIIEKTRIISNSIPIYRCFDDINYNLKIIRVD